MFIKNILCVFLSLSQVFGKPQSSVTNGNCKIFEDQGYSCVDESQCGTLKCKPNEDERGGPKITFPNDCSEDDKTHAQFLSLACDNVPRAGIEALVCCHESSIVSEKPAKEDTKENANCITFKDNGYSCVTESDCKTSKCIKDTRGGGFVPGASLVDDCKNEKDHINFYRFGCDNTPKASTEPYVCCHETSQIKSDTGAGDSGAVNFGGDLNLHKANNDISDNNSESSPKKCGFRTLNSNLRPRIVGTDTTTYFGDWPHMCALFQNGKLIGGATLIAPGIVLTAAHVVNKVDALSVLVRCGDWDISNNTNIDEFLTYQELPVIDVVIHPRFESDLFLAHDIALLHTKADFRLNEIINPVCLPSSSDLSEVTKPCIATGWGQTSSDPKAPISSVLKQVELELKDKPTCQEALADKDGTPYKLDDSAICAASQKNGDTCEGDGGGPLICRRSTDVKDETYILVGITSWGKSCGDGNAPGVYASVANNLCFIDVITKCFAYQKFVNYYDYKNCGNWRSEERVKIDDWIRDAEKKVNENADNFLQKILAEKSLEKAKKAKERLDIIDNYTCVKK